MTRLPAQYAVVGSPIEHSISPQIHAQFATQFGETIDYVKCLVQPGELSDFVRDFRARGGQGLNVTVPLKSEAWALAGRRDEWAEHAGAVNTLVLSSEGPAVGHNTDGLGLVTDLTTRHQIQLQGCRILLLGAGGASQGVMGPLIRARPAQLTVANRTVAP